MEKTRSIFFPCVSIAIGMGLALLTSWGCGSKSRPDYICQSDDECALDEICRERRCTQVECKVDRDCPAGQECLDNECRQIVVCKTDDECHEPIPHCDTSTGKCVACLAECTGKCCGDDGCGGTCADLCESTGQTCNLETCLCEGECVPNCDGKECGPDGCRGVCQPGCRDNEICRSGRCECIPACQGRECGPDGCGKTCPPGCGESERCDEDGQCQDICPGGQAFCAGECVDTTSDSRHCGGCGLSCQDEEICQESSCQRSPDCRDSPCPEGYYCDLGTGECKPGCAVDSQCPLNEYCDVLSHSCMCTNGYHRCFGVCVSDFSIEHCGASCEPCPTDPQGTSKCDGSDCFYEYGKEWSGQEDWAEGDFENVDNSANPDELRLDDATLAPHPFIWIACTNTVCNDTNGCLSDPACYQGTTCHTLKKFDVRTNELVGTYSSWGWSPSRIAIALDNSIWVGNRGCQDILSDCEAHDPRHGNAVHLDTDGNLLCRADVTGTSIAVRAVAIDREGDAWLGSWGDGKLYKYSGTEVDDTHTDGIPRCVKECEVDLEGSRPYGAFVGGDGFLWIAALSSGALKRIDTSTCRVVTSVDSTRYTYGVAVDRNNNAWYGSWNEGAAALIRVDGVSGEVDHFGRSQGDTGDGRTRGVALDRDGNIWVAEWTHNTVSKFAPDGTHLGQWSVAGLGVNASGPVGVAVDSENNVWAINYSSGHASKFDADGNLLAVLQVCSSPYTYSDMTGSQVRAITRPYPHSGTWTVNLDSGHDHARWKIIEWSGSLASDDKLEVRARSAPAESTLSSASWSTYHEADPATAPPWHADISGETPTGRWLQIEVAFQTDDELSPALSLLKVLWER